ncbi:MAG: hypothetical protein E7327_11285 [Clostridiales bacterium]|nr:hypothetical protein [Clostridiales bacterium]
MDMDRKVISWRGIAVMIMAFLVVFGIAMFGILSSRRAMEKQYQEQQSRIVDMEMNVSELKNELARVGTDGYVENEAREKYDYIKSGEMRFEFSDPQKLQNYTEDEWQIIVDENLY